MQSKVKRKLLAELKQLKIRQKCVEKNITWSIKLKDVEDDELEFLKSVEKMKTQFEKNYKANVNDAKSTVKECLTKVHQFQKTIANYEEDLLAARPSELLKTMAEINVLLSENLYICNKEMASLKFQSEHF
ncbi:CLUMA_CG002984, isoform A [Clunio marinus]|uniref:CLUMA_CG002984, isoform A n=1 Tax=Clunio marinus TaxID=568069 RepID=A0A1J1HSQ1_9DIPT|nr:CLUMA_CG002984, isoform A [Clunio marinus]